MQRHTLLKKLDKVGIFQLLIMKNYLENRLFNNIKVLKVLLNFLKAIKMRCFKEKADTAAAKIRADNK